MLYCLLRILDQHIEFAVFGSGSLSDEATGKARGGVSVLDFLENSAKICRLVELILQHQSSPVSSTSASSASVNLCERQLQLCSVDWRTVWIERFVKNRLLSPELAQLQPMLRAYLWQLQSSMDKNMQLQCTEAMTFV